MLLRRLREPTWSIYRDEIVHWVHQQDAETVALRINRIEPHPNERRVTAADVMERAVVIELASRGVFIKAWSEP
jgi:ribosomal protein S8E